MAATKESTEEGVTDSAWGLTEFEEEQLFELKFEGYTAAPQHSRNNMQTHQISGSGEHSGKWT